jgi:hypothetical protein
MSRQGKKIRPALTGGGAVEVRWRACSVSWPGLAAHPPSEVQRCPERGERLSPNGLGRPGVALCRGTPLRSRFDIAWLCYDDPSVLRFMDQSTPRASCTDKGIPLHFTYPRVSPVILRFHRTEKTRSKREALEQLNRPSTGVRGSRAAPLRLRLPLVDLSGAQYMHKRRFAGPRPTCCTFMVPPSRTGSLSLAGTLASPFVPLSHPRSHTRHARPSCLLLSNSLNAWPVSGLACHPRPHPACLYIPASPSEPSRPSSTSAVTSSFSLLVSFLSLLSRTRGPPVLQWLCFLDLSHRPVVYITSLGALPPRRLTSYPSCRLEQPVPVVLVAHHGSPPAGQRDTLCGCRCSSSRPMRKRSLARVHRPNGRPPHSRPPDDWSRSRFPCHGRAVSLVKPAKLARSLFLPTRPGPRTPPAES